MPHPEVPLSVSSDHKVQRHSVEGLRTSNAATLSVLIADAVRLHIERVEPSCVADLFALSECVLTGTMAGEMAAWAQRARREILDLPDGNIRATFVQEVGELAPELVPRSLREAVAELGPVSSAQIAAGVAAVVESWAAVEPKPVVLPTPAAKTATKASAAAKTTTTKAPAKARTPKTPAAQVDTRRADWIREDAVSRLASREYQERGLKESIFLAGLKHRSPFKDMTDEEIKVELRKLERERKLKHTGERWMVR